jgi:ABC-type sugar transport system ATPase subunit
MRDGSIEQVAAPLDLYDRPADTFVAGFIGSPAMNIWPCTIVRADGIVRVRADGFRWDDLRVADLDGGDLDRERVLLGVRPHDIDLTPPDASDAIGRVDIVEPLGPTTLAHISVDQSPERRARIVVGANTRMAVGDRVGFRVQRDHLHWFDQDGRRLGA